MDIVGNLQSAAYLIGGFLFVLTLIVFVHELGHFLVARWCGVKVVAFSIGFGPELFGFFDRHGTRWRVAAIPLGGYVKFLGDENAASATDHAAVAAMRPEEREVSFAGQPVAARAAIVVAGPLANFILAIAIFALVFMTFGRSQIEARVDEIQPGSAAAEAGFQAGDQIVAVNGRPIRSFTDMQRVVSANPEMPLEFELLRGDERIRLQATPQLQEVSDGFGGKQRIGVLGIKRTTDPTAVRVERSGPVEALSLAFSETWFVVERTGQFVGGLFAGRESAEQLGGPIRIAMVSGRAAAAGFDYLLTLAAYLSISIGLLNLVPIPMLDGGHLLFYAIEALRGRPLSERAQEFGLKIGLAMIAMLMIFATFNDSRFLGRFLGLLS